MKDTISIYTNNGRDTIKVDWKYFNRLINFGEVDNPINQLEFIINTWSRKNHRHSALQAAIFDPKIDHSHQRQLGFPCLQHVVFHYDGVNGCNGLSIIGFYANQLLFEKAYGNYLGLFRLGKFMASEMKLKLVRVICISTNAKLSDFRSKHSFTSMIKRLKGIINNA